MATTKHPATYVFNVLDRPGLTLPASAQQELTQELRALAATCLQPVPNYQCLLATPGALDDKLIAILRDTQSGNLLAFTSTMYLDIPLAEGAAPSTVLHTGLTCISAALQRQGLVAQLFFHIFAYLRARPEFARGMWVTGLAGVPSTLGELAEYAGDVYPSPRRAAPSETHVRIAKAVNERYREAMLISPEARFDEEKFVFYDSNPNGSCFRKDTRDKKWHHRDASVTEFYCGLLGAEEGNEVLAIGYVAWDVVFGTFQKSRMSRKAVGIEAKL